MDLTEDPGLVNHRTRDLTFDMTEDPGLINHRTRDLNMLETFSETLSGNLLETNARTVLVNSVENNLECCAGMSLHSISKTKQLDNSNSSLANSHIRAPIVDSQSRQSQYDASKLISKNDSSLHCNPFDVIFLKFGTFDQYDMRFSTGSRGNQCTCNCLVYLVLSFVKHDQNELNADNILNTGDQIYKKTVEKLKTEGKFTNMLLNFNEIPNTIELNEGKFRIEKKNTLFGAAIQTTSSAGFLTLQEALADSFKQSSSLLVMIGAICSAVYFDGNAFYFFDSHSHTKSAMCDQVELPGVSIIIGFNDIDALVSYMYSCYTSMYIDLQSQFEVLSVSFTCMDTTSVLDSQIANYFKDQQEKRNKKQISGTTTEPQEELMKNKSKSIYMKQYMQKRRKDKNFRSKERVKERDGKQLAREDEHFRSRERVKERDAKQLA